MAKVWNADSTEWWWVCGATGALVHCWWDYKLVQPLWKTVWRVLTKFFQCPIFLQIGKGVRQGCILSPCLFNLYAEYIMRNAGLGEAQGGVKITERNINNLRYADDTTIWQKVKRN